METPVNECAPCEPMAARERIAYFSPAGIEVRIDFFQKGSMLTSGDRAIRIPMWAAKDLLVDLRDALRDDTAKYNAYELPIGTTMILGRRRWKLVLQSAEHPDWLTWRETSSGANTPDRVMNPSEVQALMDIGIPFEYADAPSARDLARQHREIGETAKMAEQASKIGTTRPGR